MWDARQFNMKEHTKSQCGQDLWVLEKINKQHGYFIEAGALDGIYLSNTYMFETQFNWSGICCEPDEDNFRKLVTNRRCNTNNNVLYNSTGEEIVFYQCYTLGGTKDDFEQEVNPTAQWRVEKRLEGKQIIRETITLTDLLQKYDAPTHIDYISLDTEGSEYKILQGLDFEKYTVTIFSIEHNTNQRADGGEYVNKIKKMLGPHGYSFELLAHDVMCYREDLITK